MPRYGKSWWISTKTELVVDGPVILHGAMQHNTVASSAVTIYDGLDESSGRFFTELIAPTTQTIRYDFQGVQFDRGLYVVLAAGVHHVTLIFSPVERVLTGPQT